MYDSESLGMGEIDLPVRAHIGMNLGCCHMILAFEKDTSENITKLEVIWVVSGLFLGTNGGHWVPND